LTPEPARKLLCRSWPDPAVVVTGFAGAVEGGADLPVEVAGDVLRAPFEGLRVPPLVERVPSARALLAAVTAAAAHPAVGELPPPPRRGIVVGTWTAAINEVIGFIEECESVGAALVNPGLFPFTVMNAATGLGAIETRCEGPNVTLNNGPTSPLDAVAQGADLISRGQSDLVLCGGFESWTPKSNRPFQRTAEPVTVAVVLALARAGEAHRRGGRASGRVLSYATGELPDADPAARHRALAAAATGAAGTLLTNPPPHLAEVPAPAGADGTLLGLLAALRALSAGSPAELVTAGEEPDAGAIGAALLFGPPEEGG
jgi:hypothetical protein